MVAETAKPTVDFFVAVATVIPIAFLAGVVEMGLSATSSEGDKDGAAQQGFNANVEAIRWLGMLALGVASFFGEFAALEALWNGHDAYHDGISSAAALSVDGTILLLMVNYRLSRRTLGVRLRSLRPFQMVYVLVAAVLVVLLIVGVWLHS